MSTSEAPHRELALQRLERLRQILHESRVVRVDELCAELGVSPATVRRDLAHLEGRGEAQRVHGGAVSSGQRLEEPQFEDKATVALDEKRRIADAALKLIRARDTIYLDGGSTVLELATRLRDRSDIVVVTNSLRAAWELSGGGPTVNLVGGELRRLSQTMVGPLTRLMMEELHVDKAFMGTMGLSLDNGLTTTDPGEAYTKLLVMERAQEVILLADASKAGKVTFASAGDLSAVDHLITDRGMDETFLRGLKKEGVTVTLV